MSFTPSTILPIYMQQLNSSRKNSASLQATALVIQRDGRLVYRPYDTKTDKRSCWMDVVAFKRLWLPQTYRPVIAGPKDTDNNEYSVMFEDLPVHGGQEVDYSVPGNAVPHWRGCCRPVGESCDKLKCEEKAWVKVWHCAEACITTCKWTLKCLNKINIFRMKYW